MNHSIFKIGRLILVGTITLMTFSHCHLFKQGRYKVFNGMKFHTFTLDNNLEVLAISDKRFVKSSAALAVMAGSMQNPNEHLGLAHFLEHMLFLGTKEYPEVGEYENYLNKNGGGHNAYTSIDHTNYFFDIDHSSYEGALQRFSRFFVSPTFDEKYVEREKNAVHSEHEKNLKDDSRREYRFQQIITDPNHPFSKFATGDKDTLGKANRDVVMDFYTKHYSSNLMRLVLMSDLEPEKLEGLAKKHFSDIPNKNLEMPKFGDELFKGLKLPKLHSVQTVRDRDTLKLSFDIPDDLPYWKSKPTIFLAHLLGDEGEGSLLSFLKKKGWALDLGTSTWWRMFNIRITMTEKGKANFQEIIKATFAYIELMKKEGLKKYIFDERKVLAEVELQNIEPKSSMSRASNYSASMLYYPVESFLSQYYLYHEYSQSDFDKFLEKLTVGNMQVTVLSKDTNVSKKEEYYGIGYESKDLSDDLINELRAIGLNPELKYPIENPFVPTDMSLVSDPKIHEPKEEESSGQSKYYYQVDTGLEIPKGSYSLSFVSNAIKGDPLKYLLAKVFVIVKKEELNEWGYPARLAGLNYSISHGNNTISVDVNGYSQHLNQLLTKLIFDEENNRSINNAIIDESLFEKIKTKLKKNLLNREYDAAYQHLLYEMNTLMTTGSIHRKEYVKFIDSITLKQVNDFAKDFFSEVAIRVYGYGNIKPETMKPVIETYLNKISDKTFSEEQVSDFESRFIQLPEKRVYSVLKGVNNNNAQVTVYKSNDWTIKDQAMMEVLSKVIEQPYFTELRTHQQLGYIVAAFSSSSNGFTGLGSLIQSQNFEADDIYERSHKFLQELLQKLSAELKDEDIAPVKQAIVNELTQQPNTLSERHSRFISMAGTYHGDFQFYDKLTKEIQAVTASGLQTYIKEKWLNPDKLSQMTMLYYGSDSKKQEALKGLEELKDLKGFKESQPKIQPYKKK